MILYQRRFSTLSHTKMTETLKFLLFIWIEFLPTLIMPHTNTQTNTLSLDYIQFLKALLSIKDWHFTHPSIFVYFGSFSYCRHHKLRHLSLLQRKTTTTTTEETDWFSKIIALTCFCTYFKKHRRCGHFICDFWKMFLHVLLLYRNNEHHP